MDTLYKRKFLTFKLQLIKTRNKMPKMGNEFAWGKLIRPAEILQNLLLAREKVTAP